MCNHSMIILFQGRPECFIGILVLETRADIAVNETALDLVPVLGAVNPLLQPLRVVPEPVLLVTFP